MTPLKERIKNEIIESGIELPVKRVKNNKIGLNATEREQVAEIYYKYQIVFTAESFSDLIGLSSFSLYHNILNHA